MVLNINPGYNEKLMEKCKTLKDYMVFVSRIREYGQHMSLSEAVEKSIKTCIEEDILADFLRKNRTEVLKVSIYEYNEALHIQQEREEAMDSGLQKGVVLERIRKIHKKIAKGLSAEIISDMLEEEQAFVEKVAAVLNDEPDADVERIYTLLNKTEI